MAIRVTEAANILGVSANTIRNYCKQGILPFEWNAANQRVFDKQQLLVFKNKRLGILQEKPKETIVFYTRTSNENDILLETQEKLLTDKYGEPYKIYFDKASGLNENRTGLKALIKDAKKGHYTAIAITHKDRLTRFGYSYLVELFQLLDIKILLLESEEAPKEPQEALLQDFMNLIASFSGKYYRLRGYVNQKKLLHKAGEYIEQKQKQ